MSAYDTHVPVEPSAVDAAPSTPPPSEPFALVPSISIDTIIMQRNAMADRVHIAHKALCEVHELSKVFSAPDDVRRGSYGIDLSFNHTRRTFTDDDGIETMIKSIDADGWGYLLRETGLRSFMDATARKEWDDAIQTRKVPDLTRANIEATFTTIYNSRGEMFERGVLAVFRNLSHLYKTNEYVKLGKRLVVKRITEQGYGGLRVAHAGSNTLDDLVRVMSVLDGKPEPDHQHGAHYKLTAQKWPHENKIGDLTYFTLRGFKNGNAHITFVRHDIVDKMNAILAKHHPNALPPYDDTTAPEDR